MQFPSLLSCLHCWYCTNFSHMLHLISLAICFYLLLCLTFIKMQEFLTIFFLLSCTHKELIQLIHQLPTDTSHTPDKIWLYSHTFCWTPSPPFTSSLPLLLVSLLHNYTQQVVEMWPFLEFPRSKFLSYFHLFWQKKELRGNPVVKQCLCKIKW